MNFSEGLVTLQRRGRNFWNTGEMATFYDFECFLRAGNTAWEKMSCSTVFMREKMLLKIMAKPLSNETYFESKQGCRNVKLNIMATMTLDVS